MSHIKSSKYIFSVKLLFYFRSIIIDETSYPGSNLSVIIFPFLSLPFTILFFFSVPDSSRLGLNQGSLFLWMTSDPPPFIPPQQIFKNQKFDNTEIPILERYDIPPPESYWKAFPSNPLPNLACENRLVDPFMFLRYCKEANLNEGHNQLISDVSTTLLGGANLEIDRSKLPPLKVPNAKEMTSSIVGPIFSDKLASGIKEKIYSGPFDAPLPDSRLNGLFVIEQGPKHRIITDLSQPAGASFNDAVRKDRLRKLRMSTPSDIMSLIVKFHGSALLTKIDLRQAFQQCPVMTPDIKLLAFTWLDKYWYSNRLVFGGSQSPIIFDDFNYLNTLVALHRAEYSDVLTHRVLDDLLNVDTDNPKHRRFIDSFIEQCNKSNILLAPQDGKKAFVRQECGEMLGILMDSKNMTWSLSNEKRVKILTVLYAFLEKKYVQLIDLQKLLGVLNRFSTIIPPLKAFRSCIIADLKAAYQRSLVLLSPGTYDQIKFWINMIQATTTFLPMRDTPNNLSPHTHRFYTDAAGCPDNMSCKDIGAGAAWINPDGIIKIFRSIFPDKLVTSMSDDQGRRFGNKTMILELLAVFLPLSHEIHHFTNSGLIIMTDNVGVVYAFKRGRSRVCDLTSCLIQALNILICEFSIQLEIRHVKRRSTVLATIADKLTRADDDAKEVVKSFGPPKSGLPMSLHKWTLNPHFDQMLGFDILSDIENNRFFV